MTPHRRVTALEGTPKMFCVAKIFEEEKSWQDPSREVKYEES